MSNQLTTAALLAVDLQDGTEYRHILGPITITAHPDGIHANDLPEALAKLLRQVGTHLTNGGTMDDLPLPDQGEGVSQS
ncbi:hypothetical protein [Streptomyces youssoufiensis]